MITEASSPYKEDSDNELKLTVSIVRWSKTQRDAPGKFSVQADSIDEPLIRYDPSVVLCQRFHGHFTYLLFFCW